MSAAPDALPAGQPRDAGGRAMSAAPAGDAEGASDERRAGRRR